MSPDKEKPVVMSGGGMLPDEWKIIIEPIELLEEGDEGDYLTVDEAATELKIDIDS